MVERTRGYVHRVNVRAPLDLVWRALIDPQLLAAWCGPGARISARAGGSYYIRLNGELEREALIDLFEPARRLRLIYLAPPGLPENEAVAIDDFMLEMERDVAVVRLLGSGFPYNDVWDAFYLRLRAGWGLALARLKVYAEQLASGKAPAKLPAFGAAKNS